MVTKDRLGRAPLNARAVEAIAVNVLCNAGAETYETEETIERQDKRRRLAENGMKYFPVDWEATKMRGNQVLISLSLAVAQLALVTSKRLPWALSAMFPSQFRSMLFPLQRELHCWQNPRLITPERQKDPTAPVTWKMPEPCAELSASGRSLAGVGQSERHRPPLALPLAVICHFRNSFHPKFETPPERNYYGEQLPGCGTIVDFHMYDGAFNR